MKPTTSSGRAPRRLMARWVSGAALAAALSALALVGCGPRDDAASARQAVTSTPVANSATATTAPGGTTAAGAAPVGTPVPAASPPPVAVAPTPAPAVVPPPPSVAQAPTGDDRVEARPAPAPAAQSNARVAARPAAASGRLGSIESIEPIRERPQGTGAGAVIGGVAGAVLGNQFGHGLGRAAMTGIGAAGGAIAGNNVERNVRKTIVGYRVHVRLDDGATRTFERDHVGNLHVGDRVRVDRNGFRRA
jgi:outer membrane lipoprotein SlyB